MIMLPITVSEALLSCLQYLSWKHYANNASDTSVGGIKILPLTPKLEALSMYASDLGVGGINLFVPDVL